MDQSSDVLIARQPIFDRGIHVVGYEILFRGEDLNEARLLNRSTATATVVLNSLTEIGLDRIVGTHMAWINVPRGFLLEGLADTLPPRATCFEILEGELIDDEMIQAIAALKAKGYRIALDDFELTDETARLLPLADVVKLDYLMLGRDGMAEQVQQLRGHNVQLLAEKVETHADHAYCAALGCDLFQGFFYRKPELLSSRRIELSRGSVLQVIAALQNAELQFADIEPLIAHDVPLSLRLLRYINSAFFGLPHEVASVRQAMVLLGLANIRRWASLTVLCSLEGRPSELTTTALVRARFCELAAPLLRRDGSELFTLGLFSLIDAMMDAPLAEILDQIPFPQELQAALLHHEGEMGALLDCVGALEEGYFGDARSILPEAGELYVRALIWANEAGGALFATAGG